MSQTDARSAIGLLRAIRLIERVDQQQLLAPDAEPQQQPLAPVETLIFVLRGQGAQLIIY